MISLKCTVCGGDMIPNGEVGVCDSCGRKVALAGLTDDRKIENRNRANEARLKQDYSAAERAWSRIVADEPDSPEAHWNLAISRYGVDYIWDDLTGEFYPAMNRVQFEKFTDDPDYRAAVRYADENGLVYYMEEGQRLEELRERLLTLVKDEQGYDVFLCGGSQMASGWNSAAPGGSQGNSKDAQAVLGSGFDGDYMAEIDRELSAKGLRVFYGREALAGIPKQEQEPYIFSALYTSRVMILFGSAAEQLSELSVKNEWSRYLALMEQDDRKYLIPAYAHMRPEFFPDEIPAREAIDLTASGSMMDLVRGVLRFTGKDNAAGSYAEVLRIKQLMAEELKNQNFREVLRLGREGTEIAPDDADIWYYLFFGENRISSEMELSDKVINWMDSRSFTRAYELSTRQRRTVLERVKTVWEEYQQRLSQDKQLAEDEKAVRAKSAETAARARTMMMRGFYQEAFHLLTDNVMATEEIADLRDDAELGCEYEKIDKENYLMDMLDREKPHALKKFLSQSAPLRKGSILPLHALSGLLGAAMMAMLYYFGFSSGTIEYGQPEILLNSCRIFGPAVFVFSVYAGIVQRMGGTVWFAFHPIVLVMVVVIDVLHFIFLPFLVEELLSELFGISPKVLYLILMILFLIVTVIAVHDIPCQSRLRRKRCTNYYSKEIAPVEKRCTEAYRKKYERLTSYGPLNRLTTVWDKYKMSKEEEEDE